MKKLSLTAAVLVVLVIFNISAGTTSVFAWDVSTHIFIANDGFDGGWLCSRWAKIGASTPDFAWFLKDLGRIDDIQAILLHDEFLDNLNAWNFLHECFAYGVETHLCADPIADDTVDAWIKIFLGLINTEAQMDAEITEFLHLAFEFSVGSLVVDEHGRQSADLIFLYWPAKFVERVVKTKLDNDLDFDVSAEFIKYMTIQRILDKLAKAYAPYLKGEVGVEFLEQVDMSELLSGSSELPDESFLLYFRVLEILLTYPTEIYEIITAYPNWVDVLDGVFMKCTNQ